MSCLKYAINLWLEYMDIKTEHERGYAFREEQLLPIILEYKTISYFHNSRCTRYYKMAD